ncbi:MAG: UbiA family prenyltransferase [Chitinivibrionia bacterium]|nr:UbiA family prenyltransferase [Chitinivibrionia bacterium]
MPIDLRAYCQLMRLPNVFTAMADILAGYFIVAQGRIEWPVLGLLILSSSCLYSGGIVLNDYFDYEVDKKERPQRPLPSGRISGRTAALLGWGLLGAGILFSLPVGAVSGGIAVGIAAAAVSYDRLTKGMAVVGPLNMGFCRFLNFTLGMSPLLRGSPVLFVPLILMAYITALTFLSRKEAGNLRIQRRMKWLLIGIVPLDAAIVSVGAGVEYGGAVLILLLPVLLISRLLYMT